MKMLTATTEEIDDTTRAVEDILSQLDLESNLLAHSVGIMTCYNEFIESGVVKAVCEALPFDVVGCTTLGNGSGGQSGLLMLCLTVLTADDVFFSTAMSSSMAVELNGPVTDAFRRAQAGLNEKPALIIPFAPLILQVGGELIFNELNALSDGVPLFGTIACDHTEGVGQSYTIHNGVCTKDCLSLLLISGNIHPRFFVASISENKIQKQKAIITDSTGNLVRKVNDMTFIKYMATLGISRGDGIEGMNAVPIVVDYNDDTTPVTRAIYMLTPEGYAICGGAMPEGATLAIGSLDYDNVLETVKAILKSALAHKPINGLLMFPCLSRYLVLGLDALDELDAISDCIGENIPYQAAYSGGEICPVYDNKGHVFNRFHNFTCPVCIF
ncbi:MAG: FIST C-terminal domain-containing protein [Oscillospiraceae bacterium]|jgi:hypothetical protein|nr:FIST C-terminal domain-containing protein [Oscillospiraceae bacterium]